MALSRGTCDTVDAILPLRVQHSPARLPSVVNFTPGETLYFASKCVICMCNWQLEFEFEAGELQ